MHREEVIENAAEKDGDLPPFLSEKDSFSLRQSLVSPLFFPRRQRRITVPYKRGRFFRLSESSVLSYAYFSRREKAAAVCRAFGEIFYRLSGRIHSPVEQLWKMTKKPSLSVKAEEGTKVQISLTSSGGRSLSSAGRA